MFYNILIDLTSVAAKVGLIPVMKSFATTPHVGPESVGPVALEAPSHCCVKTVFESKLQLHIKSSKFTEVVEIVVNSCKKNKSIFTFMFKF